LLLEGLGVYVESRYIGVSTLARYLQQQGYQTRVDTHMMNRSRGLVPDVIIGHSMGGETALRYAGALARSGQPAPLVITIDAAPAPPACTVPRCINIHGPGFANVRGATNISAWSAGARYVNHAQLPMHPAVANMILAQTGELLKQRRAPAAKVQRERPESPTRAAPSAGSTRQGAAPRTSSPSWAMRTPAAPAAGITQ